MNHTVKALWPELEWIENRELREKTAKVWEDALKRSALNVDDLNRIPFTLLVPNVNTTLMAHKRAVVHLAKVCGETIKNFLGKDLPVNMDVLISGAILCDVGKLLEYELKNGKAVQGDYGKYVRHPFSGVSLAERHDLPAEVCHIIATHASEGDLVKRTIEAYIVHYVDFMTYLPYKEQL
jgi:putative nucleotidyltransferase with HDIG domain